MKLEDATTDDDLLGFLLVTASRLLRLRFERALDAAKLDITTGEARTLAMASRLGSVRQSELAACLSIEPMTLVGYLDRLEKRGLIRRVAHPADRRSKLVQLTTDARPLLRRIRKVLAEARNKATSRFEAAELATLQAYLRRLCNDLGDATPGTQADA